MEPPVYRIRFQICPRRPHSQISYPTCCPVHRFPGQDFSEPRPVPTLILLSLLFSILVSIYSISAGATFSQSLMPGRRAHTWRWDGATINLLLLAHRVP